MNQIGSIVKAGQLGIIQLPGREPAMLDRELAEVYGVETRYLNRAAKRNSERFPEPYSRFKATEKEMCQIGTSLFQKGIFGSKSQMTKRPYLYTQHGSLTASFYVNTPDAVSTSHQIIQTFIDYEKDVLEELRTLVAKLEGENTSLRQQVKEGDRLLREKNRQLFLPGFRPSAHPSTRNTIKSIIAESSGPGVSFQRLYRMLLRLTGFDVHAEQERLVAMAPCSRKPTLISIVEGQSHRCFQGRPLSEVALDLAIEMVDGVKREMRPLQLAASNSNVEVA